MSKKADESAIETVLVKLIGKWGGAVLAFIDGRILHNRQNWNET